MIGRLRIIGCLEGVSYLLLLGVAMPLKYLAGLPEAVLYTGWVHGILFMTYGVLVLHGWISKTLDFKLSVLAMVAAILPLGPFFLDGKLRALNGD